MVDRMKQLQRNTVTNADIIDGALVLKRYDGSRLTVESGTSGAGLNGAAGEQDDGGQTLAAAQETTVVMPVADYTSQFPTGTSVSYDEATSTFTINEDGFYVIIYELQTEPVPGATGGGSTIARIYTSDFSGSGYPSTSRDNRLFGPASAYQNSGEVAAGADFFAQFAVALSAGCTCSLDVRPDSDELSVAFAFMTVARVA